MSSVNPHLLIESNGVNNMGASFNSDAVFLGALTAFGVQANTDAGTHVGTLGLQASNDAASWTDITLSTGATTVAVANGVNPNWVHSAEDAGYTWFRVVYTRTSGDGQLDVIISRKRG